MSKETMKNKLVGLTMVRNESDIIEAFVRHNLSLLDELHIVDHGSSDNTRSILSALKNEGLPIYIYFYDELEFAPVLILNHMMKYILENDADANFIFPLDGDEFIYAPSRQQLEHFLSLIPEDRVGMYTWRGYLPNTTEYDPDFVNNFVDQRRENILTPKVIIPRAMAEKSQLTIGSHYMVDNDDNEIKSAVFISPRHSNYHGWFKDKFDALFFETDDFWLAHYPIRSTNQQIKKVLEKSITMAIKAGGGHDVAWEIQLKDLLDNKMSISIEKLRLIAYQYRASEDVDLDIYDRKALTTEKLALKYLDLVDDSPLPIVARLILQLTDKLRK